MSLAKQKLFVTCKKDDTLLIIDLVKLTVEKEIAIGRNPRGVAALPDGSQVFVACHDEAVVRRLSKYGKLDTFAVPPSPDRLVLRPDGKSVTVVNNEPGSPQLNALFPDTKERSWWWVQLTDANNCTGLAYAEAEQRPIVIHQRPKTKIPDRKSVV